MIGGQGLNRKLGIGLSFGNCDGCGRPEGLQSCRNPASGCRQRTGLLGNAGSLRHGCLKVATAALVRGTVRVALALEARLVRHTEVRILLAELSAPATAVR